MKTFLISMLGAFASYASLHAQNTPLTEVPADEVLAKITCELTEAPKRGEVPVFTTREQGEKSKGVYQYNLWLPPGYAAAPTKAWPCIFIMSPSGNASLGKMKDWIREHGFIAVLLVDAKNGDWEPIVGNFLAAHDDVIKRVRVLDGQKYATGFSGGARGSSVFVQSRGGFCGLVLQGAGFNADEQNIYNVAGIKSNNKLRVAVTMGKADSNFSEVARIKKLLPTARFADFEFEGGHEWAPAETFARAMASIEGKSGAVKPADAKADGSFDIFKK